MELVDTHCHLYFDKLKIRVGDVIDAAGKSGVTKMVCVGTSLPESQECIEIAQNYEGVWAAVGAHPHEAAEFLADDRRLKKMQSLLASPKVVAVGEIGLDYYKSQTPKDIQQKALRQQIEVGIPTCLPFSFHVRDAFNEFWPIFDEYDNLTGVIHSFSSGVKQLNAALERGLYIGLNGIMTFTRDHAQQEAAKRVPLDRLVLETDAPFLTPAPNRDETCEPRHVVSTAEFLANLRGETVEKIASTTTANAIKLFGLE